MSCWTASNERTFLFCRSLDVLVDAARPCRATTSTGFAVQGNCVVAWRNQKTA